MTLGLALLAVLLGLVGTVFGVIALRRTRRRTDADDVPEDVLGLRREVAALRAEAADALRNVALVRYDAFGDMGGHLSWSLALLDDHGGGIVLTSIHGRSDTRTYAKSVADWASEAQLSPEETEAIANARPRR